LGVFSIDNFAGGIDTHTMRYMLPEGQYKDALNFYIDSKTNKLIRRRGYAKFNTAALASDVISVDAIMRRKLKDASGILTIIAVQTTTYSRIYLSTNETSWTEITGGSVLAGGATVRFLVYRDILFICNGSQFQYYTGTGNKADVVFKGGTSAIVPSIMAVSDDKIFAKTVALPYEVFFTIEGGWTTDPGTDMEFPGYSVATPYRDQNINGIFNNGTNNDLVIGTTSKSYSLTGVSYLDYVFKNTDYMKGMVSQSGMCMADVKDNNALVFAGNGTVYACDSSANVNEIGEAIRESLATANMAKSVCVYLPRLNAVLFTCPDGSYLWNCTTGGWTNWDIFLDAACLSEESADNSMVLCAVNGKKYIYKLDSGETDDGADIKNVFLSAFYDGGDNTKSKSIKKIFVSHNVERPATMTISCTVNGNQFYDIQDARIEDGNDPPDKGSTLKAYRSDVEVTEPSKYCRWVPSFPQASVVDSKEELKGLCFRVKVEVSGSVPFAIDKIGIIADGMERL